MQSNLNNMKQGQRGYLHYKLTEEVAFVKVIEVTVDAFSDGSAAVDFFIIQGTITINGVEYSGGDNLSGSYGKLAEKHLKFKPLEEV